MWLEHCEQGDEHCGKTQRGCRGQLMLDLVDHGKEQLGFYPKCMQLPLEDFEQES